MDLYKGEKVNPIIDDFSGILQADCYSGYARLCVANGLTRIGCWNHALHKFIEATQGAQP
ncbi:MAG: transposase, partial [Oceanospirillales bacterium]|nr:transposase [Oceanospirillales bacterium]